MTKVLVVGATGQLGARIVNRMSQRCDRTVRALVRPSSKADGLFGSNVEIIRGDLRDKDSLIRACEGIDVVVATATVVFPKGRYSFHDDEKVGYQNLIDVCTQCGVKQIFFMSLSIPFRPEYLQSSQTFRMKAWVESLLAASGLGYTVLRCSPFMDDYFALIGSRIPLVGEKAATLNRVSGMTRALRQKFGNSVEKYGLAVVPGPADNRHTFVAIEDVVSYVDAMTGNPEAYRKTFDVGGPAAMSWHDVADLYAALLRRRVVVRSLPLPLLRFFIWAARPFSEALSNQTSILWVLGKSETNFDSGKLSRQFGVKLTSASAYLEEKFHQASARFS
jgi:uncharacterized protein YbjT (DUF2867 family)